MKERTEEYWSKRDFGWVYCNGNDGKCDEIYRGKIDIDYKTGERFNWSSCPKCDSKKWNRFSSDPETFTLE